MTFLTIASGAERALATARKSTLRATKRWITPSPGLAASATSRGYLRPLRIVAMAMAGPRLASQQSLQQHAPRMALLARLTLVLALGTIGLVLAAGSGLSGPAGSFCPPSHGCTRLGGGPPPRC